MDAAKAEKKAQHNRKLKEKISGILELVPHALCCDKHSVCIFPGLLCSFPAALISTADTDASVHI